jgi:hypothetical protein
MVPGIPVKTSREKPWVARAEEQAARRASDIAKPARNALKAENGVMMFGVAGSDCSVDVIMPINQDMNANYRTSSVL